jgi:prephenate dehydrogenase
MPRRALIIGLGLIGGSAGIALRARGWRVGYFDPNVAPEDARAAGAADEWKLADPDVVLLATPVDRAVELVGLVGGWRLAVGGSEQDGPPPTANRQPPTPIVTSACSVMRPLRAAASTSFVAGHPLAGSHQRGLGAARGDLFEGKAWFLDAEEPLVDELVRDCGAVIERVGAEEHDAAIALTSHLPQILSTALGAYLQDRNLERFAGSGLRTFLRLAGSDASVWAPVIEANRDNLALHAERLAALVREIIEGDPRSAFERAQAAWRALEERSR